MTFRPKVVLAFDRLEEPGIFIRDLGLPSALNGVGLSPGFAFGSGGTTYPLTEPLQASEHDELPQSPYHPSQVQLPHRST
jgi:hypothetical protein